MTVTSMLEWRLIISVGVEIMRDQHFSCIAHIRVGPFDSKEEAFVWEMAMVQAVVVDWGVEISTDTNLYQVEARTAHGQAVVDLAGVESVHAIVAPPGKQGQGPEVLIMIGADHCVESGSKRRGDTGGLPCDIDPKIVPAAEFARDLKGYLHDYGREALDDL